MPAFYRLLSPSAECASREDAFDEAGNEGHAVCEEEFDPADGTDWNRVTLWELDEDTGARTKALLTIERSVVAPGSLAASEIEEFLDAVREAEPSPGTTWLAEYLPRIKTIYIATLLDKSDEAWDTLGALERALHEEVGGILQADYRGFTNDKLEYVVWEETVSGELEKNAPVGRRMLERAADFERGGIPVEVYGVRTRLTGKCPRGSA